MVRTGGEENILGPVKIELVHEFIYSLKFNQVQFSCFLLFRYDECKKRFISFLSEACHVLGSMPSVYTHYHNCCPNTLWERFSVVKPRQCSMMSVDC